MQNWLSVVFGSNGAKAQILGLYDNRDEAVKRLTTFFGNDVEAVDQPEYTDIMSDGESVGQAMLMQMNTSVHIEV